MCVCVRESETACVCVRERERERERESMCVCVYFLSESQYSMSYLACEKPLAIPVPLLHCLAASQDFVPQLRSLKSSNKSSIL